MRAYITKIRGLTNNLILKSLLLKDQKKWNLMCGSLDAIESAQLAVDAFCCLKKNSAKGVGEKYLMVYGLLQTLYVQQDSMWNLCKSLNISMPNKDKYPELLKVRQLRNKGVGHPSKDLSNNTHSILIEGDSINLYCYTETGEFSYSTHNISDCIDTQNQSLCKIIQQVIEKLMQIEKKHKDKYMKTKLRDCFPADLRYCIGKMFEAINLIQIKDQGESPAQRIGREGRVSMAFSHADTLLKAINIFNKEFAKRDIYDVYVDIEIEYSIYPLEKLKDYFNPKIESSINSQDARAYADSAEKNLLELVKHAEALDSEYSGE